MFKTKGRTFITVVYVYTIYYICFFFLYARWIPKKTFALLFLSPPLPHIYIYIYLRYAYTIAIYT